MGLSTIEKNKLNELVVKSGVAELKNLITEVAPQVEDCRRTGSWGFNKQKPFCIHFFRTRTEGYQTKTRPIFQYFSTIEKAKKALKRIQGIAKQQAEFIQTINL